MNPDHLRSLLSAGVSGDPGRSPVCPDEQRIAGYVDGGLDATAREQLELHLADCGHCLALVGLLCRERGADPVADSADGGREQARNPVTHRRPRRWRLEPQWAAAAALVLAVPLLLQLGRNLDGGDEGQGRPDRPATRNFETTATELRLLSPGAGAAVDAQHLSFRWTELSGTPYYDVRIVTDEGDLVIQERVTGTTWQPPGRLDLQPGAEYFVHIDAYPSGDKAVNSGHVPFRVSD